MIEELKEPLECGVCGKPKILVFIIRDAHQVGIGIKCKCGLIDTKV
jgi:hypothetical protein